MYKSEQTLLLELKNKSHRLKPGISEHDAQIIAEYRMRVLMDQDLA